MLTELKQNNIMKSFLTAFTMVLFSCTGSTQLSKPPADDRVLKDVYKDAFLIGTAVNPGTTSGRDKTTQEIVIKHFNSITVENVMKAALINPEPGVYNFGQADDYVAFGEKNKMFIIGHTLVWHNQCPAWFFTNAAGKPNTKEEQIERLRSHIEAVAGRYAGRVHAWDVVNEVISDKEDEYFRPSLWYQICGEEFVAKAFQWAHEADPKALLFYNDYNEIDPVKRQKIIKLVNDLKAKGIPINGIGLQGHWAENEP